MKWITISDDLQVRLEDGKPKFSFRQGFSLEEVIEAVDFWLRTHENADAEAWLERAADELDLRKREACISAVYRALDDLGGPELEHEPPRILAIRQREEDQRTKSEFIQGEEAFRLGEYEKALAHLSPLATVGHPAACFLMGQLYEKGAGVPQSYVKAYVLFALAADGETPYPADEAKARIEKLMPAEELKEARRIAAS